MKKILAMLLVAAMVLTFAACADTGNKDIHTSIGIVPDLGAGRFFVRRRIGRIPELIGKKRIGDFAV